MANRHDEYFAEVEARFDRALDFDLGLEEEFHILEPGTLALTPGFEALRDAAPERLHSRIAGELLRSEIEVSTPRTLHFGQAAKQLLLNRAELFALADREGYALGATGTHPFSAWKDQEIIDTPHYRLVEERLKYVAWRNNTWAAHVHVGVRGRDRAVAVCDALRTYLPHLLALSANSPFIEDVWTQLHSVRTQTFVRMFPRCGIPDVFGTWAEHRRFYEELVDTNCIQEFTQIWWAVRPHHRFGTVEVRICDAQAEAWQSLAISSLTVGVVAHLARVYDEGLPLPILPNRYIEENLWRAIRFGLDGKLVDWSLGEEVAAGDAVRRLLELAQPHAAALGLAPHLEGVERMLREGNGAQQQVRAHRGGEALAQVFAGTVARARASVLGGRADEEEGQT
ncbi:MAG: YbdK family carboxylate-amine ligase [Thermoleophilia bacterium]